MANEIVALERDGGRYRLAFLYPIASPVKVGGSNVVPTPWPDTDPPDAILDRVLTQGEKDALNAGTALVHFQTTREGGKTGASLLAHTRAIYAKLAPVVAARYAARYEHAGKRFDKE